MNELFKQTYHYTAENTTQVVVGVLLLALAVYYLTELLWPVMVVAIVGGLVIAYGAGIETIENMDDVEVK